MPIPEIKWIKDDQLHAYSNSLILTVGGFYVAQVFRDWGWNVTTMKGTKSGFKTKAKAMEFAEGLINSHIMAGLDKTDDGLLHQSDINPDPEAEK